MGIPGLTTYVYSKFLDKKKRIALQGSPIVVDGNGLLYYLYEKSNFKWQYGGQFAAFTRTAKAFLNALLIHQVQPIHLVFDGINPSSKQETLKKNRKRKLTYIIEYDETKKTEGHYQPSIFHPLLFEVFFRFLEVYNEAHGGIIKIYCADEEADDLAVSIANTVGCPLIGDDSDYFISPLLRGYMPLSTIEWEESGSLTGKLFCQNAFALEVGLSSDLIIAIPAIVGNDCITSLFETIFPGSRKVKAVEIVDYTIEQLKEFKTVDDLKQKISPSEFNENLDKARATYGDCSPFDMENFKVCSFQKSPKQALPAWIIEQYRNCKLSKYLLEILIREKYFLPIVPHDHKQESIAPVLFSRCIRQKIYGVMNLQKVSEEVYTRDQFECQQVESTCMKDTFSFSTMNIAPVALRLEELYAALLCKPCTLSSLSEQWHVAVASVCYWAKTAHLARNGLKIKALLLCFTECYYDQQDTSEFDDPVFDRDSLHVLTQWQCAYHDAIMLNQVLALPIHYLSPASIFDGKRVTYYYQKKQEYFDRHVHEVSANLKTFSLYKTLLEVVNNNL